MDTLGNILKSAREEQKLSLNDVSRKLNIRFLLLTAFENDDFSGLPPVYARLSVKSYADYLKISNKQIEMKLDEIFKPEVPEIITTSSESSIKAELQEKFKKSIYNFSFGKDNKSKIINYLIYAGIVLSLVVLVYFSIFSDSNKTSISNINDASNQEKPDTAKVESKSKGLLSFFEKPDSIILEARAIDTSWLRIDIDGTKPETIHMAPNVTKRWSAENFFLLTVGNVGSIEFRRNGSLLKPFGTMGSVVRNVKITKDEVISSSMPWSETDTFKIRKKIVKKEEQPQIRLLEESKIDPLKPFKKMK